jgi:hypothetical protein
MKRILLVISLLFPVLVMAEGCADVYTKDGLVGKVFVDPSIGVYLRFQDSYSEYQIKNADVEGVPALWSVKEPVPSGKDGGTLKDNLIIEANYQGLLDDKNVVVKYNGQKAPDDVTMKAIQMAARHARESILHVRMADKAKSHLVFRIQMVGDGGAPACYHVRTHPDDVDFPAVVQGGPSPKDLSLALQQAKDSLTKYRGRFHRHEISLPEDWKGPQIVEAYDDGQETVIVLNPNSSQDASVFADVDGKRQLVDARYTPDSERPMWVVSGLYPGGLFVVPGKRDVGYFQPEKSTYAKVIRKVKERSSQDTQVNLNSGTW